MRVPLLNFEGGPGVPLLIFEGGPLSRFPNKNKNKRLTVTNETREYFIHSNRH